MRWQIIEHNGREYAQRNGVLFKCCTNQSVVPDGWTYIGQIKRWVNSQCIEKRSDDRRNHKTSARRKKNVRKF